MDTSKYFDGYISDVSRKLHSPSNVTEEEMVQCVNEAISIYSRYRPRKRVSDSTGCINYLIDLPTDYIDEFSDIISVEYPYSTDNVVPYILKDNAFITYREDTGLKLRAMTFYPGANDVVRITYTTMHSVDSTSSTIPIQHQDSVSNLAAGLLAEMLAAEYEKQSRTTLPDVSFDLRTKSSEYQKQADRYYALFRQSLDISDDNKPTAACAWTDIDMRYSWGRQWLTRINR